MHKIIKAIHTELTRGLRTASTEENSTISKLASVVQEKEIRIELDSVPGEVSTDGKQEKIIQGIIADHDGATVRVRKTIIDDKDTYTLTAKYYPLFQEAEMEISPEMFDHLVGASDKVQTKTRYKWEGWDVDHIIEDKKDPGKDGKVWAEYELTGDALPTIPESWGEFPSVQELVKDLEAEADKQVNVKVATLIHAVLNELGL